MDLLATNLLHDNQDDIKDEFDYVCLFIHTFIIHEFKIEVIQLSFNLHILSFYFQRNQQKFFN